MKGFKRRSIYLGLISIAFILTGLLFLTEDEINHLTLKGSLIVKPHSINATLIKVLNGDIIRINVTPQDNENMFQVYISSADSTYYGSAINISEKLGINMTFDYPSGEYYLVVLNKGVNETQYYYVVDLYRVEHVEKYNGVISLTGVFLALIALIMFYIDLVSYHSKKYPDFRENNIMICRSIKLNKHSCSIKIPLPYMPEELRDKIIEYYKILGYNTKKNLENVLILERTSLNPFSKKKPALLMINLDPYNLEFYYSIPHSRAAGTIDLEWIFNEVQGLINILLPSTPTRKG